MAEEKPREPDDAEANPPSDAAEEETQASEAPPQEGAPHAEPPAAPAGLPAGSEPESPAPEEQREAAGEAEELLPPELTGVRLPLVGTVPFWAAAAAMGGAVLVLVAVVVLACWQGFVSARGPGQQPAAAGAPAPTEATAEDMAWLDYKTLLDRAALRADAGQWAEAARLYRIAAGRQEEGIARVLLARYELAVALARSGRRGESLEIGETLRAVSRPGDQLWKHSLVNAITVLADQGRWKDYYRCLYLLRANTARYPDEIALSRWLAYEKAMGYVRMYLARNQAAATLFGMDTPPFGQMPCPMDELEEDDIVVTGGRFGDGQLHCDFRTGELLVRAEGVGLLALLDAFRKATGIAVKHEGGDYFPVSASLEAVAPEQGLEILLGSVGLAPVPEGEGFVVQALQPSPATPQETLDRAVWAVQEALILYPESTGVPEEYYALAHLYVADGRTRMGLDQLDILCGQAADSPWAAYAHYVAGRAFYEQEDWTGAAKELALLADTVPGHPLAPSANLWAAQSMVRLGRYADAVGYFRRALANETQEALAPEILYNIAFCTERVGPAGDEVEQRYLELCARYPDTPYARRAEYRLGRMALDQGRAATAVRRFETFLQNWPIGSDESRLVCRDLINAYLDCHETVRAVILAQIMLANYGQDDSYWEVLPGVLDACREQGFLDMAAGLVRDSRRRAGAPWQHHLLEVCRAEILLDAQENEAAQAVLSDVEALIEDPLLKERAALCRARLTLVGNPAEGLEACRALAAGAAGDRVKAEALRLMGACYEQDDRYDRAVLAYSGKYPAEGETQTP